MSQRSVGWMLLGVGVQLAVNRALVLGGMTGLYPPIVWAMFITAPVMIGLRLIIDKD